MKTTRSDLFHELSSINPSFYSDLENLWNISKKQQTIILDLFPSIINANTERESRLETENLANKLGPSKQDALKIISVLQFINSMWNPREDTATAFFNDFKDLGLLPQEENKREKASVFLQKFFEYLEHDSKNRFDRLTINQLLPSIKYLHSSIENRAVVESLFDWNVDDPRKYTPKINRTVSLAILKIKVDDGDSIIFQCSKKDIEMVINKLQSVIKEMDAAVNINNI